MEELLKTFPVVIETPVAWGDMDALQHVNNTVYFRYFESARMAYFDRLDLWAYMRDTGTGPILANARCRFRLPITYPDTVFLATRVARVEADRFLMEYAVLSHRHGKIAAEGDGMIVAYDYRALKKTALPDDLKERIRVIEASVQT